jgi:hypothetical protein
MALFCYSLPFLIEAFLPAWTLNEASNQLNLIRHYVVVIRDKKMFNFDIENATNALISSKFFLDFDFQDGTGSRLLRDVPRSALRQHGRRLVVGHHAHRIRSGTIVVK